MALLKSDENGKPPPHQRKSSPMVSDHVSPLPVPPLPPWLPLYSAKNFFDHAYYLQQAFYIMKKQPPKKVMEGPKRGDLLGLDRFGDYLRNFFTKTPRQNARF